MKTTIEIPDALAVRAKRFVASSARGTTLRDLVIAGLESELDRRERPSRVDFKWVTAHGEGLSPESHRALDDTVETPR